MLCTLTDEALSPLNPPTSPGGPEEDTGPSPLPVARSCWPISAVRWCSGCCSCCQCLRISLPASAECWLLGSFSSSTSCWCVCEVAGCSPVAVDAPATECAVSGSTQCGFSLQLKRLLVGASTSSVVLTALCWDCTSRGWVSLSCKMLLIVATQARKAETRQGSRNGLQAGGWQTGSVLEGPVESSAASHPQCVPHP